MYIRSLAIIKKMKMKDTIKLILPLFILSIISACNTNSSSNYSSGNHFEEPRQLTETELKQQLLNKECSNGVKYLDGKLKYSPIYKNPLSMKVKGLKLSCTLKNKATLATFKDIKVKVMFESKTVAKILERSFDIYEFISANGSFLYKTEIKITNQQFKDISNFSWTILKADCK